MTIKLSSSTTVDDLAQHFPNAVAAMDEFEVHDGFLAKGTAGFLKID
ncbi:hypothetical protein [Sphingobacterium olei]|nr:hypothetical protein [Sphingobacterium olei]